jgi:choline kinase
VNAIVLVAGVARRLAPLTDATHKALLRVGGRPVLARLLEALASAGIRRTVLVVGHCADQVRALAGERVGRMSVHYVHNPEYTRGSVLSRYAAREYL